jgi:hypothetical protein
MSGFGESGRSGCVRRNESQEWVITRREQESGAPEVTVDRKDRKVLMSTVKGPKIVISACKPERRQKVSKAKMYCMRVPLMAELSSPIPNIL